MAIGGFGGGLAGGAVVSILIRAIDDFSPKFDKINANLTRQTRTLGLAMVTMGAAGAAAFGLMIQQAGRFEQVQIGFRTLIGDVKEADQFIRELSEFAARTPFTLPGVEQAARQLSAVGFETQEILPLLKSLGDVSSGLGLGEEGLRRLILNLGQVKTQAKLTGRELRDFAIAGVPLLSVLADNLGKTTSEIRSMISAGKITSKEVIAAFESMSGTSGKFANLMEKQSKTLIGQLSNLSDSVVILSRDFGETLLPIVKILVEAMRNLVDFFGNMPAPLKRVIVITGALVSVSLLLGGAFLFLLAILPSLQGGLLLLPAIMTKVAVSTGAMTAAVGGFVAALAPFLPFIIAGGIIVTGLTLWWKATQKTKDSMDELNDPTLTSSVDLMSELSENIEGVKDSFLKLEEILVPGEKEINEELRVANERMLKLLLLQQQGGPNAISWSDDTTGAIRRVSTDILITQGDIDRLNDKFEEGPGRIKKTIKELSRFINEDQKKDIVNWSGNWEAQAEAIGDAIGVQLIKKLEAVSTQIGFIEVDWKNLKNEIESNPIDALVRMKLTIIGTEGEIIGLAHGGIVTKPTLAVIGEAGPEAVIPLSRGSTGLPGVGGDVTVNIENLQGVDPDQMADALQQKLRNLIST